MSLELHLVHIRSAHGLQPMVWALRESGASVSVAEFDSKAEAEAGAFVVLQRYIERGQAAQLVLHHDDSTISRFKVGARPIAVACSTQGGRDPAMSLVQLEVRSVPGESRDAAQRWAVFRDGGQIALFTVDHDAISYARLLGRSIAGDDGAVKLAIQGEAGASPSMEHFGHDPRGAG